MWQEVGGRTTDPRKRTIKAITLKLHESDGRTNGQTQQKDSPKNERINFPCGGKRMLEGGLDSPNKRAQRYG
jgi:hypothetical protein